MLKSSWKRSVRLCLISLAVVMAVACGGGTSGGGSPLPSQGSGDTTPDAFGFQAVAEASEGALVVSEVITIMGIGSSAPIQVFGGEYRVDDGVFTSVPGRIGAGSRLMLRLQASIDAGATASMMVSVGGVDAVFDVVTRGQVIANKSVPSTQYPTLAALLPGLRPGDVVDVRPLASGQPYPPIKFRTAGESQRPIILRGVRVNGSLPRISGYSQDVGGTLKFEGSHHMVLDSFEVTNGANPLTNTDPQASRRAGYCIAHQARYITIKNTRVFDCLNHGILGADEGSGSLTLDRVEVTTSGCDQSKGMVCESDSLKHPVYVATDPDANPGSVLRVQNSYLHNNIAGETIKSRAERAEIVGNWIEARGRQDRALGLYGYDGATASLARPIHHDLVGNVLLVEGENTSSMARIGGDGTGSTYGRTRFVNNTVLLGESFGRLNASQPVVRLDGVLDAFAAHNNVFHVGGTPTERRLVLVRENGGLQWASGQAHVLFTHNHVPEGSMLLRTKAALNNMFFMEQALPAGYVMSDWVRASSPGFAVDAVFESPDLRPTSSSPLRAVAALGTQSTNRAPFHQIPAALLQPLHNAPDVAPGLISRGAARRDTNARPVLGAYD